MCIKTLTLKYKCYSGQVGDYSCISNEIQTKTPNMLVMWKLWLRDIMLVIMAFLCWCHPVHGFDYLDILTTPSAGLSREEPPSRPEQIWDNPFMRPGFDNTSTHFVTSVGRVAYVTCRINYLGNRVVTWMRQRDAHILTVGLFSYTTDQRFTALHAEGSGDWVLKITSAQVRDSGIYECQVSTEPKISKPFNLTVVDPVGVIEGSRDIHTSSGNTINVSCTTNVAEHVPIPLYWFHNGRPLHLGNNKSGITTMLGPGGRSLRLVISKVQPWHSGNYTCVPEGATPISVSVYVLLGEVPAAMQHGETNTSNNSNSSNRSYTSSTTFPFLTSLLLSLLLTQSLTSR
ncbi:hemicentin-1-like [Oratosquilla oratoria]|uniref:hemicentin-1-like n=1 Tax=Oratosquilla oratoria TaxID=337810 RepID=UPI003F7589F1